MASQHPSPDDLLRSRAFVPDHVVYRSFEAETLLLNLRTSQYHGVNPTGGRLLELLEEPDADVGCALTRLAAEYGMPIDEIEEDMTGFCLALLERGLLELRDRDGG